MMKEDCTDTLLRYPWSAAPAAGAHSDLFGMKAIDVKEVSGNWERRCVC